MIEISTIRAFIESVNAEYLPKRPAVPKEVALRCLHRLEVIVQKGESVKVALRDLLQLSDEDDQ